MFEGLNTKSVNNRKKQYGANGLKKSRTYSNYKHNANVLKKNFKPLINNQTVYKSLFKPQNNDFDPIVNRKKFAMKKFIHALPALPLKDNLGIKTLSSQKVSHPILNKTKFAINKFKQMPVNTNAFEFLFTRKVSDSIVNKKNFVTKRFKPYNKKITTLSLQKINNSSNFYNLTKIKLTRFFHKIKTPNLKNKYITLINKYYTLLNDYDFNTTGQYHSYYSYFTSLVNHSLKNNKYCTSNFYSFLNTRSKSLPLNSRASGLKKTIHFKSKAFKLSSKLSKTRKIKNIMYKLKSVYRLFGLSALRDTYYLEKNNISLSNLDRDNLTNNLYRILDKSLISKAKKKMYFTLIKAIRIIKKARRHKNFLFRTLKWDNKNFINYEEKYYNKFLKKAFRKEIMYLYYVRLLSINNNKFKN